MGRDRERQPASVVDGEASAKGRAPGRRSGTDQLQGAGPRPSGFTQRLEIEGPSPVYVDRKEPTIATYRVTNPDQIPEGTTVGWLFPTPLDHRKDEVAHVSARTSAGPVGEFALQGWKLGGGKVDVQALVVRDADLETLDTRRHPVQVIVTDDAAGRAARSDAAARERETETAARAPTPRSTPTPRSAPTPLAAGDWVIARFDAPLWAGASLEAAVNAPPESFPPGELREVGTVPADTRGLVSAVSVVGRDERYLSVDFYRWDLHSQSTELAPELVASGWVRDAAVQRGSALTLQQQELDEVRATMAAIAIENEPLEKVSDLLAPAIDGLIHPGESGSVEVAVRYGPPAAHLLVAIKTGVARGLTGASTLTASLSVGVEGVFEAAIVEAVYKVGLFLQLTSKAGNTKKAIDQIWLDWRMLLLASGVPGARAAADMLMGADYARSVARGMTKDDSVEAIAGIEASGSLGSPTKKDADGNPIPAPKLGGGVQASAGVTSTLTAAGGVPKLTTGSKVTVGGSFGYSKVGTGTASFTFVSGALDSWSVGFKTPELDKSGIAAFIEGLATTLDGAMLADIAAALAASDAAGAHGLDGGLRRAARRVRDQGIAIAKLWGEVPIKTAFTVALSGSTAAGLSLKVSVVREIALGGNKAPLSLNAALSDELFTIAL